MLGTNEMRLNPSTMALAIQYWLTNQVWNANSFSPTVDSVTYDSSDSALVIILKSQQEQPK